MSRASPELLKKLSKFSKEQIIEAIGRQFNSGYIISGIINDIEATESDRIFKEHEEALTIEIAARKAFSEWTHEAATKYGDGKSFKISALPPAEYAKGAFLEKAVKEATEKEQRLDKKINKLLKL